MVGEDCSNAKKYTLEVVKCILLSSWLHYCNAYKINNTILGLKGNVFLLMKLTEIHESNQYTFREIERHNLRGVYGVAER